MGERLGGERGVDTRNLGEVSSGVDQADGQGVGEGELLGAEHVQPGCEAGFVVDDAGLDVAFKPQRMAKCAGRKGGIGELHGSKQ